MGCRWRLKRRVSREPCWYWNPQGSWFRRKKRVAWNFLIPVIGSTRSTVWWCCGRWGIDSWRGRGSSSIIIKIGWSCSSAIHDTHWTYCSYKRLSHRETPSWCSSIVSPSLAWWRILGCLTQRSWASSTPMMQCLAGHSYKDSSWCVFSWTGVRIGETSPIWPSPCLFWTTPSRRKWQGGHLQIRF